MPNSENQMEVLSGLTTVLLPRESEVRLSLAARNQKLPRYPSNSSLYEFNQMGVSKAF